ncbi:MAG: GIY-YIG nuclease family protein [Thermomonas sp.]
MTSNLIARTWQHRNHVADGFIKRYGVEHLVWYEQHDSMESAIQHEKQLKKWNRAWKTRLIESLNPAWKDLRPKIIGDTHDIGKAGFPHARE